MRLPSEERKKKKQQTEQNVNEEDTGEREGKK